MTDYRIDITTEVGFATTVRRVKDALLQQGFGALTEIDVAAVMREKLGIELAPYLIIGACMPSLAHRALEIDPTVGLLLPCNVVVRAVADNATLVEAADPRVLLQVTGNTELAPVATEAWERLTTALARVRDYRPPAASSVQVQLEPGELQLMMHALRSFLSDFGHDEADVLSDIHELLGKLEVAPPVSGAEPAAQGAPAFSSEQPCPAPALR
jgi:uncharacterized protein (DUF302 family)